MNVRLCAVHAAVFALVLAGCSPVTGQGGGNPLRTGTAAAWTMRVATGEHTVVVFGDVVVVTAADSIVGADRRTGQQRWTRPATEQDHIVATSDSVAQYDKNGLAVFDPATGADRWQVKVSDGRFAVYQSAVYADDCGAGSRSGGCTLTARDVHSGQTQWTLPVHYGFTPPVVSVGAPYAQAVPKYLVAGVEEAALVDTATGKPLPGRVKRGGWYVLPAGELMVVTDNDSDKSSCVVTLTGFDGRTGAQRWSGKAYSGRQADNQCIHFLGDYRSGRETIGADARLAACSSGGRPVVVDLATGATVWTGTEAGTPVDGDATGILTLDTAGRGGIAFYDLATGQQRWKAPDPGLEFASASWVSAVTGKRVAVVGAEDDHPFVLVFDRDSGRPLGRFPSWLAGAGDDWVAVTHGVQGAVSQLDLEFIPV